MASALRETRL